MPTFNAYVDGFNLFKGALERRPKLKWLDVWTLCEHLLPNQELQKVYYFTSRIRRRFEGDKAPDRQNLYLRILENSGVNLVFGRTERNENWVRVASQKRKEIIKPEIDSFLGLTQKVINRTFVRARPDVPKALVKTFGEKGTDVNIASLLLRDHFKNEFSTALLISGDSDLVTPVEILVNDLREIHVVIPNNGQGNLRFKNACESVEFLDLGLVAACQFPDKVISPKGKILRRPDEWV